MMKIFCFLICWIEIVLKLFFIMDCEKSNRFNITGTNSSRKNVSHNFLSYFSIFNETMIQKYITK